MATYVIRIRTIIGAAIAVLLQVIVASNIRIGSAMPDFVFCYVVAVAVVNARNAGYTLPFVLGLLYDFMSSGSVGAMALVCVACTWLASTLQKTFDNETLFVPMAIVVVTCLVGEVLYALLVLASGAGVGLLEALVWVVLPCTLYDIVFALIAFALVARFVFKDKATNEMKIIDTKIE